MLQQAEPIVLTRRVELPALGALFVLTLRQHLRGRRLLILSLLFLLPSVLAAVVRFAPHPPPPGHLEFGFVLNLIPHALLTLTTLLYAAGIVQDEVEEQTLTYLLTRPLPRWALYLTKLAATFIVTCVITAVFTVLVLIVIYWNTPELWGDILPGRALKIVGLLALAQVGYCALFGVLGLLTRWSLFIGLGYIVLAEGLLATFGSVARRLTIMYYFRVLSVHWLDPADNKVWSLDIDTAPSARECVFTIAGVSVALTLLGAILMLRREFRMKTPEGS
jgi:ABC-2 type transport system permease protein